MKKILILMLILALSACNSITPVPIVALTTGSTTNMSATAENVAKVTATDPASGSIAYYGALINSDLDRAMALVADEDINFRYADPCIGNKEKVRAFWQGVLADGWIPYLSILSVDGNTVSYACTAVHNGEVDGCGTGNVIVEDGKVRSDE
jgi:hypothetical protein